MRRAVANIDQDYEWKLIVGGEEISTSTHYDIIDPNTTGIVGKAPEATVQQLSKRPQQRRKHYLNGKRSLG